MSATVRKVCPVASVDGDTGPAWKIGSPVSAFTTKMPRPIELTTPVGTGSWSSTGAS